MKNIQNIVIINNNNLKIINIIFKLYIYNNE